MRRRTYRRGRCACSFAKSGLSGPWAMRRPLCGIAGRVPGRLTALHSRMTIGVSWSGRIGLGNGESC